MKLLPKDKNALITGAIIGFALPFVSDIISGIGFIPAAFVGAVSGALVAYAISKFVFK